MRFGMHVAVLAGRRLAKRARVLRGASHVLVAKRLRPRLVESCRRSFDSVAERVEREAGCCEQLDLAAAVLAQLLPVVADAQDARVGQHRGRAVACLVVELAADDDQEIRFLHGACAHRADDADMFAGDEIAALLRVEIHRAGAVEEPHELAAAAHRTAAGQHQRALRFANHPRRLLDVGRIRRETARRLGIEPLAQHELRGDRLAQHVGGNLDVDGPRRVAVARGGRIRLVEIAQHVVGEAQRARHARDRPHDVDVRDALQWTEIVLRDGRAAADQQHRDALELRVGHRGHAVGDAWTGGDHRDADAATERRVRLRHVNGSAFVAHVDDAHAALAELVPDRLDVPALQAEHAIDAARDQEVDDDLGDRSRVGCGHAFLLRWCAATTLQRASGGGQLGVSSSAAAHGRVTIEGCSTNSCLRIPR